MKITVKYLTYFSFYYLIIFLWISCTNQKETSTTGLVVEMRQNVTTNNPIVFSEEITHIEYIPLEFTPDGASMLAEAMDLAVTDDFVFVNSMKQGGVFQFSRADGKFIRKFALTGNGPGETQLILNIYADEANKDIYIVQSHNTLKYNFEGEFISTQEQTRPISLQYPIGEDRIAQLGAEFVPFNTPELIDMGVFTRDGEIVKIKDDFARPDVVSQDNSCIKDVRRVFSDKSILYFIDLNDTIFRLSSDDIQPAFVLNRQNSREYLEGSMTPRGETMLPNDFWVYDFFETPGALYVRALYNENEKMHLFAFDKATRTTTLLNNAVFEIHNDMGYVRQTSDKKADMAFLSSYIPQYPNGVNTYPVAMCLGDSTFYLRIPNFYSNTANDLVEKHWNDISIRPNLIIDIRYNGGGQDNYYQKLAELIYTNPYESKGVEWYSTKGIIEDWENAIRNGRIKKVMRSRQKRWLKK